MTFCLVLVPKILPSLLPYIGKTKEPGKEIPRSPVCNDRVCLFLEIFQSTIDDNLSHTEPEIQVIPSWPM